MGVVIIFKGKLAGMEKRQMAKSLKLEAFFHSLPEQMHFRLRLREGIYPIGKRVDLMRMRSWYLKEKEAEKNRRL